MKKKMLGVCVLEYFNDKEQNGVSNVCFFLCVYKTHLKKTFESYFLTLEEFFDAKTNQQMIHKKNVHINKKRFFLNILTASVFKRISFPAAARSVRNIAVAVPV